MDQDLRNFFHRLQTLLRLAEEPQRRFEARYAPRFNPLDLVERERTLAEMLALLLDPQREHGQGRLFLDAFLDCLGRLNDGPTLPPLAGEVKVETEKMIDGARRLDILVSSSRPPDSALAIEVKVEAKEQPGQLGDYLDWLRRNFQHSTLVFVAPEGRKPSIEKGIVKLPWTVEAPDKAGSIVGWLTLCRERCRAERVRWFLEMLIERIETMVGQSAAASDPRSTMIESYLGVLPENLRLGAEIAKAFATLQTKLPAQFAALNLERLPHILPGAPDEWQVENRRLADEPQGKWCSISIRRSSWYPWLRLSIGADGPGTRGPYGYGLSFSNPAAPAKEEAASLKDFLSARLPGGKSYEWWPWCKNFDPPFREWTSDEALAEISAIINSSGEPAARNRLDDILQPLCEVARHADEWVEQQKR